jgi:hypothetical protein
MDKNKTYIEMAFIYLKDKYVEVHTASYSKMRKYSDFDHYQKEVIRGIFKSAEGDLLIIEVFNKIGNSSNLIYVNGWSVTAIIEPKNGISIIDAYVDEHERQVK